AVAGGELDGQYEFTGKTGLGLGEVIPKIGLGNGAKLSLDPSFGLDQGEWSGNLGLGLKDWNPFPNPALTLALGLDGKMNSEGEYSLDASFTGKMKLNPKLFFSAGCLFTLTPSGTG